MTFAIFRRFNSIAYFWVAWATTEHDSAKSRIVLAKFRMFFIGCLHIVYLSGAMRITNAIITTIINNTFILFVYWSVLAKGVAPLMWRFPISPLPGDSITSDLSIIVGYPQANWVGQWTNLRPTSEKNQCKILASSRYLGGIPPFSQSFSKDSRLAVISSQFSNISFNRVTSIIHHSLERFCGLSPK